MEAGRWNFNIISEVGKITATSKRVPVASRKPQKAIDTVNNRAQGQDQWAAERRYGIYAADRIRGQVPRRLKQLPR